MIRLFLALAVLFFAGLGILWVLGIITPESAQDLLIKGGAVLAISGVAAGALMFISRGGNNKNE